MCAGDGHGRVSPSAFLDNLKGPMPLGRKLGLILLNSARKVVTLSHCCGHPGEPGC